MLKITVPEWKEKNRSLPVIPDFFPVEPIAGKEQQCNLLANLMNRADVVMDCKRHVMLTAKEKAFSGVFLIMWAVVNLLKECGFNPQQNRATFRHLKT